MSRKLIAISLIAVLLCGTVFSMGINASSDAIHINMETKYGEFNCRYDDSYFMYPASEYNPSLVTTSYVMVLSCTPKSGGYHDSDKILEEFSKKAGFTHFESNNDYKTKPTVDSLGMAIASKQIENDYTLLMVCFRWEGYRAEWANNFDVGLGSGTFGHHEGFEKRIYDKVFPFIQEYIDKNDITGKIKIWTGGYSRGGGMANMMAGILDTSALEKKSVFKNVTYAKDDIFAFTFEAPRTTSPVSGVDVNNTNYDNIWNFVRPSDLITFIPCAEWGFKLYGNIITFPEHQFNKGFGDEWRIFSVFYGIRGHDIGDIVTTPYAFGEDGSIVQLDNPKYPSLSKDIEKAIGTLVGKIGSRADYVNNGAQESLYNLFEICDGTSGAVNVLKDVGFDLIGDPLKVLEMLIELSYGEKEQFRDNLVGPVTDALKKEKLNPERATDLANSITFLAFIVVDILDGLQDETMEVPLTLALNAFYIRDNHTDMDFIYCWLVADDPLIFIP